MESNKRKQELLKEFLPQLEKQLRMVRMGRLSFGSYISGIYCLVLQILKVISSRDA